MKLNVSNKIALIFVSVLVALLSGCATPMKNIPAPPDFMTQKASIGIIFLTTYEHPKSTARFYNLGGQGLLDIAINKAIAKNLIDRLDKEQMVPLVKKFYLNTFGEAFSHEGFEVKIIDTAYDHESLVKLEKDKSIKTKAFRFRSSTFDFRPISEELHTDYLMVLEIYSFGVGRSYYGFFPMGPPKGWTALRCYLVETRSNKVVSQQFSTSLEGAKGEWDEPPEYSNLINAVAGSFEKSADEVFIAFFGRTP